MASLNAAWLIAALVATSVQDPATEPPAWKAKIDAAEAAKNAGEYPKVELALIDMVKEAETFGPDDLWLATALERLGGFYVDRSQERYAKGEPLLRRALAIREKVQGRDHADVATTLVLLAICRIEGFGKGKDAQTVGPTLRRA